MGEVKKQFFQPTLKETIDTYATDQIPLQFSNALTIGNTPAVSVVVQPIETRFIMMYEDEEVMEVKHTVEPDKPVYITMDRLIQLAIMRGDLRTVELVPNNEGEMEE